MYILVVDYPWRNVAGLNCNKELDLFKTHKEYYRNTANEGNNALEPIDIQEYNYT